MAGMRSFTIDRPGHASAEIMDGDGDWHKTDFYYPADWPVERQIARVVEQVAGRVLSISQFKHDALWEARHIADVERDAVRYGYE